MTRRQLLSLPLGYLALPEPRLPAQMGGMGSRSVTAAPRAKLSGKPWNAKFTNVARQAGLRQPVVYGTPGHADYLLETMGCGVAFIDYDNDGWQDIILLTGSRLTGDVPADAIIRLYKNNRDGTFTDVTKGSGLGRAVWAAGITVADYDNDGFDDVFITCWGQNILFHNNGDGTFTDVTKPAGLLRPESHYATGCTWIDYDRDGKLDLFVCHYLVFDMEKIPARLKDPNCNFHGLPIFCGPLGIAQDSCRLYHNNGDGTFTDVSEKSGVGAVPPGYGLTATAADFDNDGWPDIYVACDTSPSLFFRNNHDGTFTEQGLESGVALSEDAKAQSGMGLGIGDYDNDGSLDIFKTHFSGDTAVLYKNNGKGSFRDATASARLGVETRFVCWGTGIVDLDNDGLPDLFTTTGMVSPELERQLPSAPYKTPNLLFRNLDEGRFEELVNGEAGPGIGERHSSRGLAFGDFDNDGDLDILIVNLNEPPTLLRNDITGTNHWIKVLLEGVQSNRSAIGANVTAIYGARRQVQAVLAQASYLSANDRRLHFGLGAEKKVTLNVRWPNGKDETVADVAADQFVVIREGSGIVKKQSFMRRPTPPAAPKNPPAR